MQLIKKKKKIKFYFLVYSFLVGWLIKEWIFKIKKIL